MVSWRPQQNRKVRILPLAMKHSLRVYTWTRVEYASEREVRYSLRDSCTLAVAVPSKTHQRRTTAAEPLSSLSQCWRRDACACVALFHVLPAVRCRFLRSVLLL